MTTRTPGEPEELVAWGRWLADREPFHNDYSFWYVETLSALRPFPELARQVDPPLWRKLLSFFRPFHRVYREDILRLCALLEQAA